MHCCRNVLPFPQTTTTTTRALSSMAAGQPQYAPRLKTHEKQDPKGRKHDIAAVKATRMAIIHTLAGMSSLLLLFLLLTFFRPSFPSTDRQQAKAAAAVAKSMSYAYLFKSIVIGDSGTFLLRRREGGREGGEGGELVRFFPLSCSLQSAMVVPCVPYPSLSSLLPSFPPLPSGVGKSCLLLQFTDKRFVQVHDLTIGR
jgi:hypothetical protein